MSMLFGGVGLPLRDSLAEPGDEEQNHQGQPQRELAPYAASGGAFVKNASDHREDHEHQNAEAHRRRRRPASLSGERDHPQHAPRRTTRRAKEDAMTDDCAWMDATAQAEAVRAGDATPIELVEGAIARIEKLNPQLNAVIHRLDEKALATAGDAELPAGPFRGVPFLVKDGVCHTAGDPFHCGMQVLKDIDWHEQTDTWLAERFRAAGFVFVGKTNLPELASSVTTEPF